VLAVLVALVLVKGSVTIGPLTPVCRAGTQCDGPAPHVVLTFASGLRSVRVTTGAGGTYAVELRPGTYVVTASKGMRISPAQIVVRSGPRRQSFVIDTGIR
jgi:hypothetical protein